MSKPIREVEIKAATGSKGSVDAVVDSGSFYSIIRNKNGHTTVHVGRDMSDPDVQTVL